MMPVINNFSVFLYYVIIFFTAIVIRYFIAAGIFAWYFYSFRVNEWSDKKLTKEKSLDRAQLRKEIKWSIITSLIFAVVGAFSVLLYQLQATSIYLDLSKYGYWYLPVSLVLAMLIHETYYYWVHRWMHNPKVFRTVHKVHHDSHVTSAWTAFSFHPLEGFIEALIIPAIIMIVPLHPYVLLFYLILMTVSSIINHLDIEVYPRNFQKHWFGKLFIGATHHHHHHREYKTNYGLYFTFWDRWMDTESKLYKKREE